MTTYEREGTTVIGPTGIPPQSRTASVRVDDSGLSVDGEVIAEHDDIASVALGLEDRTNVRVRAKNGREWTFPFTSRDDAVALVSALRRDPERVVLEVGVEPSLLKPGIRPLPPLYVAALMAFAIVLILLSPALVRAQTSSVRVASVFRHVLEIGADGLRIRGRLVDEFVPWSAIKAVTSRTDALVLTLRDGTESVVPLEIAARTPEVVARIERALAGGSSERAVDEHVVGLLGSIDKVEGLRELGGEGDAAYRAAHVPRERLWSLVEDPVVPPVTRARAAIALSDTANVDEKQRLRIAADASVSPKVRVAIDAAAFGDDDDALAEKLAEVEREVERDEARVTRMRR